MLQVLRAKSSERLRVFGQKTESDVSGGFGPACRSC